MLGFCKDFLPTRASLPSWVKTSRMSCLSISLWLTCILLVPAGSLAQTPTPSPQYTCSPDAVSVYSVSSGAYSGTYWNSGGYAPASITVYLGTSDLLSTLTLVPNMSPSSCSVTHYVYFGTSPSSLALVYTYSAVATAGVAIVVPGNLQVVLVGLPS